MNFKTLFLKSGLDAGELIGLCCFIKLMRRVLTFH